MAGTSIYGETMEGARVVAPCIVGRMPVLGVVDIELLGCVRRGIAGTIATPPAR